MGSILFKRGNTASNDAYTGVLGEVTLDTQARKLRIHDGAQVGGHIVSNMTDIQNLQTQIDGLAIADIANLQTTLDGLRTDVDAKIPSTEKGAASGVVPLNASSKIDTIYLSDSVLGQVEYQGTWDASTNTPTLPATPTEKGHYYVTSASGTFQTITYEVGDWIISNGTAWEKVDNTDAVTSVASKTGAVTLVKGDVGLDQVDNTSDLDKPVSTAQQSALDLKANLDSPALTGTPTAPTPITSDDSTTIATTAYVKANVSGATAGVSSVSGDAPINITGTASDPIVGIDVVTTTTDGAMLATDKVKLDGVVFASNAEATAATSTTTYMNPANTKLLIETATYTIDGGTF